MRLMLPEALSACMKRILSRYKKCSDGKQVPIEESKPEMVQQPNETDALKVEIENLKLKQLQLLGKDLTGMGLQELHALERQLNEGLWCIKERKEKVLMQQLDQCRMQEQRAVLENETLRRQVDELRIFFPSSSFTTPLGIEYPSTEQTSNPVIKEGSMTISPEMDCDGDVSDTTLHLAPPNGIYGKKMTCDVAHESGLRVFQHHSITGEMSVIRRVKSLPARLSTFDQSSEDVKDLHEVLPLSGSELEKDYGKLAKNNLESDNFCSDDAGEKVCESEGGISEFSVVEKGVEVEIVVPKDVQSEIRGLDSEEKENDDVCSKESLMKDLETSLISYATELVKDGHIRIGTNKDARGTACLAFDDIFYAKAAVEHHSGFSVADRYLIALYYQQAKMGKKFDKRNKSPFVLYCQDSGSSGKTKLRVKIAIEECRKISIALNKLRGD
ncbi:MADS-box protein AGL15 [Striga asiatica]|uniref:MADS-box protein AGL15 n=1 Tax=Striga asiatica TaxID=4170 RepID=A0A5A7QTG3_STRAF|nr:MADS-box protein AGL15 [Striga asiatica]